MTSHSLAVALRWPATESLTALDHCHRLARLLLRGLVMYTLAIIWRWLRLALGGTSTVQAIAKYVALLLAMAATYLAVSGLSPVLGLGALVDGEPRLYFVASGDRAYSITAVLMVLAVWLPVAFGIAFVTTPGLKIIGPEPARDRWRIRVRNRSYKTMQFSANLESISPELAHHTPASLVIAGSDMPYRSGVIRKEAQVDVVLMGQIFPVLMFATLVQIVNGNYMSGGVYIDWSLTYMLRISVFPCPPVAGVADTRTFRLRFADGKAYFEMIPEHSIMAIAAAIAWLLGGLIPVFIGYGVGRIIGAALGGFGGVYLVWFAMNGR